MSAAASVKTDIPVKGISLGVLLALTMYFVSTLFDMHSNFAVLYARYYTKSVEATCLGLGLLWCIIFRPLPRPNVALVVALAFLAQSLVSGFWAEDALSYSTGYKTVIRIAATSLTAYFLVRTRRDLDHFILGIKLAATLTAFHVFMELIVPAFRVDIFLGASGEEVAKTRIMQIADEGTGSSVIRTRGPMGHPNYLGFFLGIWILMTPYLWARYPSKRARWAIAITAMAELVALIFGYVRLGTLGIMVGMAWWVVRGGTRHRALTIIAVVTSVILAYPLLPEAWRKRVTDPSEWQQDRSIMIRLEQQYINLELAQEHALMGTGLGNYGSVFWDSLRGEVADHFMQFDDRSKAFHETSLGAHNSYLEVVIEQGILGLLLYVGSLGVIFYGAVVTRERWRNDVKTAQLALMIEMMVVSAAVMKGFLHTQDRRPFWMLLVLGAIFLRLAQPTDTRFSLAARAVRAYSSGRLVAAAFSLLAILTLAIMMAAL